MMDVTTNHDDPRVIDVEETRQPGAEPVGSADPLGEQEAIEQARTARFAAMLAAVQAANTATIVAGGVSLLVGIGIGLGIGLGITRTR
jgi:hypothetical protein